MSMFFCEGCQENCDSDCEGLNQFKGKDYCDDCFAECDTREEPKIEETELEKIAKQVDGNSLNMMDLDERVSKLEDKNA